MGADAWDEALTHVWDVLNRNAPVAPLQYLSASLSQTRKLGDVQRLAFGFDTNAMFRLGLGNAGADMLDYLRTRRGGPIIVPGQTLQEVWNNQLAGLLPLAKGLQVRFRDLETETLKLGERFGQRGEEVRAAVRALVEEYPETFDDDAEKAFQDTLELFLQVASVPFVPRLEFGQLAQTRKSSRTPPGFKDVGDGDFFVWADFLYGLRMSDPDRMQGVVLVTNDTKPDWSRNGVAHPILTAEAVAVTAKPFELWTLPELTSYVRRSG